MELNTEPPIKKVKHASSDVLSDLIDSYIKSMETGVKLRYILSEEYTRPIPLVKVCIGTIRETTLLSNTLRVLNDKFPLTNLQFLKRIHKLNVILFPKSMLEDSSKSLFELIEMVPELKDSFKYFEEVEVFGELPLLTSQSWQSPWPLNFHPDAYLENLVSCKSLDLSSTVFMMKLTFEILRYMTKDANFDPDCINIKDLNATLVVDPKTNSVVAAGACNRNHPTQHSSMVAIDNVAKTQFGGAWGTSSKNLEDCSVNGIEPGLLDHLSKQEGFKLNPRKYVPKSTSSGGPYLCTGYHFYTIREPCLMCSMALVHARVARLFYCFDNKQKGGVNSKVKLQGIKALNHRFEVFTGFL